MRTSCFAVVAMFIISFFVVNSPAQTPTDTPTLTATETPTPTPWPYNPDLNGDEIVDDTDLVLLMDAWHLPVIPSSTPGEAATSTPVDTPTNTGTPTRTPTATRTPTPTNTPVVLSGYWEGPALGTGVSGTLKLTIFDSSSAKVTLNGDKTGVYTLIPPAVGGTFHFVTVDGSNPIELNGKLDALTRISGTFSLTGSVISTGSFTVNKKY